MLLIFFKVLKVLIQNYGMFSWKLLEKRRETEHDTPFQSDFILLLVSEPVDRSSGEIFLAYSGTGKDGCQKRMVALRYDVGQEC